MPSSVSESMLDCGICFKNTLLNMVCSQIVSVARYRSRNERTIKERIFPSSQTVNANSIAATIFLFNLNDQKINSFVKNSGRSFKRISIGLSILNTACRDGVEDFQPNVPIEGVQITFASLPSS